MTGKKLWFTAPLAGRTLRFVIYDELNDYGEHKPDEDEIAIRRLDSEDAMRETALHEWLVHAILDTSGLRENLKRKLRLSDEQWMELEEDIAHVWSPHAHATLTGCGALSLYPIPPKDEA